MTRRQSHHPLVDHGGGQIDPTWDLETGSPPHANVREMQGGTP